MNMEKFTERSRGFLQAAQTIAMRESHQRLSPEHLLKAMMDDDQGLAANLIRRAGGEPARVTEAVNLTIAKTAKVTGDAQPFMDPGLVRVLDEAEKVATKAGDSCVPVGEDYCCTGHGGVEGQGCAGGGRRDSTDAEHRNQ